MLKQIPEYLKDWRLHGIVLLIVLLAESIGPFSFEVGAGMILILPMIYAFILGVAAVFTPVIKEKQFKHSEILTTALIGLLVAKVSLNIGPALSMIVQVGPAILLQEIGNLGTVLLGLPLALLLGVKREAIGMTFSIAREGSLAIINDKFGFNSPETRGVFSIYLFGSIFGAVFFGLTASFLATFTPLNPLALAMASGVGSASMMAASSGSLSAVYPEMAAEIQSLASASMILSVATGFFVSIFIALPLAEKMYNLFTSRKSNKEVETNEQTEEKKEANQ
ncbi:DUF3100 domain-containing protein [Oceanobacillus locisalsi]|uniref:DUF3100 domain-containing protein n=1 Tax=Oceanobacillus locisalsi TaxID=546107 RepID=A0ABW3NGY4_9BACI